MIIFIMIMIIIIFRHFEQARLIIKIDCGMGCGLSITTVAFQPDGLVRAFPPLPFGRKDPP